MVGILHDLQVTAKTLPALINLALYERQGMGSAIDLWISTVKKFGNRQAIVYADRTYTFLEADTEINRMAHAFLSQGIKPKGLVKIGAVPAFLNFNLREKSLFHCIKIVNPVAILFDVEFTSAISDIRHDLQKIHAGGSSFKLIAFGEGSSHSKDMKFSHINPQLLKSSPTTEPPSSLRASTKIIDPMLFIYTSGTTGLPKAAVIRHARYYIATYLFPNHSFVRPTDRVYCCLPLYHSSAAIIALGTTSRMGTTLIVSRKFSVRSFWDECIDSKATVFLYIGELARYLLNAFPSDESTASIRKKSQIRLAIGNGLRPDIWRQFKERFNIPEVSEFYASTEGTAGLFNFNNSAVGEGAVGWTGPITRRALVLKIVQFDPITEQPIRDSKGFCVECAPNEPGELIGKIDVGHAFKDFGGYVGNKEASEKKILKNAFTTGDAWFRTGDILKRDANYFYYFVDRVGDTFRWKGENVSTMEVAAAFSGFKHIKEANVYGIHIPGWDGQAGMAALTTDDGFSPSGLATHLFKALPKYAVPIFIRIQPEMAITGTFKHQKVELRKQGCDPSASPDKIYWLDPKQGDYTEFTVKEYQQIMAGNAKL